MGEICARKRGCLNMLAEKGGNSSDFACGAEIYWVDSTPEEGS